MDYFPHIEANHSHSASPEIQALSTKGNLINYFNVTV